MKANFIAVALSLSMLSLPAISSAPLSNTNHPSPSVTNSAKQINLNTANAETLSKSIKGIGLKRAEAIVQYRQTHGHFKSVEELAGVKGIGKVFVKRHLAQLQTVFILE